MGHYYGEMISDEEIERRNKEKEDRLQSKAARIQQRIDEKGLAYVLAEMNSVYGARIF